MSGTHLVNVATREEAVRRHREDTLSDPDLCERIRRELHGKVLVCWCKPLACHGDTLAEIADMDLTKEIGNG
jgi:hypothetical protein